MRGFSVSIILKALLALIDRGEHSMVDEVFLSVLDNTMPICLFPNYNLNF